MRARRLARLAPLVVLALLVAACSLPFTGGDKVTLYATFDDVADLVPEADVLAGDLPVGLIETIELTDGNEARVRMEVKRGTGLPGDVQAVLKRTSILGERYIALEPTGEGGRLTDGQTIDDTAVQNDVEQLVRSGNEALAFVAADQLAAAIQTGATAFGGRGSLLGPFITDVEGFVGRYEQSSDDLTRLIDSVDRLTARLADNAEDNAEALRDLERFSRALQEEDTRLLDTLDQVNRLSDVGTDILADHRQQLDNGVRRIRKVLGQVTRVEGALQGLLTWGPRHNRHVANGAIPIANPAVGYAQVWLDFNICGLTDEQGNPSEDCTPPNPGEHAEPPPYHPNDRACMEDPDNCPIPDSSSPLNAPGGGS